jgi:hypothetical protein
VKGSRLARRGRHWRSQGSESDASVGCALQREGTALGRQCGLGLRNPFVYAATRRLRREFLGGGVAFRGQKNVCLEI